MSGLYQLNLSFLICETDNNNNRSVKSKGSDQVIYFEIYLAFNEFSVKHNNGYFTPAVL